MYFLGASVMLTGAYQFMKYRKYKYYKCGCCGGPKKKDETDASLVPGDGEAVIGIVDAEQNGDLNLLPAVVVDEKPKTKKQIKEEKKAKAKAAKAPAPAAPPVFDGEQPFSMGKI